MKNILVKLTVCFLVLSMPYMVVGQEQVEDLEDISLADLLNTKISVASKSEENPNDAPGIISIISRQELEGFAANNLGEILERITGTAFLSANNWRDNVVHFRGQSLTPYNNHTLILVNGRPLRDPISGGLNAAVFNTFPVEIIDRIEVIRGPGSVLYGSCAFSGVINIVTKKSDKDSVRTDITAKAGTFKTYNVMLSNVTRSKDLGFSLGVNYMKSDGPKYSFTDAVGVNSSAKFDSKNLGALMNLSYKGLTFNGFYGKYDTYALGGGNLDWIDDPHSAGNHKVYFADLGYEFKIGKKASINLDVTFNRHEVDSEGSDTFKASDILFEGYTKIALTDKANLIAGMTFESEKYSGTLLINRDLTNYTLYVQADYKINIFKLIGGVQYNKIKDIDGDLSPRIGVIANFTEEFGAKVLYSQAFRKGYPLETSFNHPVFRGNLLLKPEQIGTFEAQLFFQSKKAQLSATYYASKMWEIIGRRWHVDDTNQPFGGYLKYYNKTEELKFWGIELEGKVSVTKNLMVTGSFNYQESKDASGKKDTTLHPNVMFKCGVLYNANNLSIGVFNSYFGKPHKVEGLAADKVVNKEGKAYSMLSAKVSYTLKSIFGENSKQKLKLFLEATNLLDEDVRYPEYTSRQINTLHPIKAGRAIMAGFTLML